MWAWITVYGSIQSGMQAACRNGDPSHSKYDETFKTGDTLHFISAEAEVGRQPGLLQRLRFQNLRIDEMVMKV